MKNFLPFIVFGFTLLTAGNAMAKFTYEGHLTDLSDNPLSNQAGTVRISVVGPASACVLFMESHTVLTDNKGFFSVEVGGGTDIDGLSNSLDGVFSNSAVLNGMASCTYTPVATDGRRLKIEVDTGGGFEALGFVALGKAPQAVHADNVGGYSSTNLVRTSGAAPILSSTDVTSLSQLIAGTSTLYAAPGASGTVTNVTATLPITIANPTSTPSITISPASSGSNGYLTSADWTTFNSKLGSSSPLSGDISGTLSAASVNKLRGYPVSAAVPGAGFVLTYNGSTWISAAPIVSMVAGRTGAVVLTSADISGLGTAALKNVGTGGGQVAAADDTRIVNALQKVLPNGMAFVGNVSGDATPKFLALGDIRSTITPGNPAFNIGGGCSPGQMITYSSVNDAFACEPFGLTGGQVISALGFNPLGDSGPLLLPSGSWTSPTYSFSGDSSTGIYSPGPGELGFTSLGADIIRVLSTGKVGIGTNSPDSKLSVFGTMRATSISSSHLNNSISNTFDFSTANLITSSYNCAGPINISNMRDGGTYKIVNTDPSTTQCTFNSTVSGIDAAAVVFKFSPPNGARNGSSDTTMYELNRFGNTVYVNWMTMY